MIFLSIWLLAIIIPVMLKSIGFNLELNGTYFVIVLGLSSVIQLYCWKAKISVRSLTKNKNKIEMPIQGISKLKLEYSDTTKIIIKRIITVFIMSSLVYYFHSDIIFSANYVIDFIKKDTIERYLIGVVIFIGGPYLLAMVLSPESFSSGDFVKGVAFGVAANADNEFSKKNPITAGILAVSAINVAKGETTLMETIKDNPMTSAIVASNIINHK